MMKSRQTFGDCRWDFKLLFMKFEVGEVATFFQDAIFYLKILCLRAVQKNEKIVLSIRKRTLAHRGNSSQKSDFRVVGLKN